MWKSFVERWQLGITFGLLVAAISSLWVTIAHVVTKGSALASRGLSLPTVLVSDFLAAFLGSIVYAAVGPLFRSRLGAGLGGFLVVLPLFMIIVSTMPGEDLRTLESWRVVALSAAFIGGLGGLVYWKPTRGPEDRQ